MSVIKYKHRDVCVMPEPMDTIGEDAYANASIHYTCNLVIMQTMIYLKGELINETISMVTIQLPPEIHWGALIGQIPINCNN